MLEDETFPSEGVEVVQWLVCPDGKGLTVLKADSEAAAFRSYSSWVEALPGIFSSYEMLPALEAHEAMDPVMK